MFPSSQCKTGKKTFKRFKKNIPTGFHQVIRLRIPGSGDSELDVWMYQHFLEVRKIKCGTLIPNDKMPDHPTVLQLLRFALNLAQTPESELLVPLCVKVLKENLLTGPLIQAISSDAVYLEYSKLSIRQRAALLVATATLLTCSMRARAIRFASEPLINTLQSLLRLIESQDGCFLRSRGIIAAKAVVPAVPHLNLNQVDPTGFNNERTNVLFHLVDLE